VYDFTNNTAEEWLLGKRGIMLKQQSYNVGIYVRLSRDDEREGDSISIENQKIMLTKHVQDMKWNLVETYVDDGFSGGDFDRPGVQKLIEDAKDGKINLILCKDLSRFGRNYIQVGQFTDYLFPMINCRFIALNDGVDTINNDNDIMPFKNLFNEFYLRDTSKKIRSVFKSYQLNGQFIGSCVPYGYKKSEEDRHKLVIDEDTAAHVRRIFDLRHQGMGYHRIAGLLNAEGIASPRAYQLQQSGVSDSTERKTYYWNYTTIKSIVSNEVYIGHMVQNKKGTLSYKSKKLLSKPKDEWIKVENTHEPIIDLDIFQFCAELDEKHRRPRCTRDGEQSLFAGLMNCMDCGGFMRTHIEKIMRKTGLKTYVGYCCGTYSRCGKSVCSANMIRESAVATLVLEDIRKYAGKIKVDESGLRQDLINQKRLDTAKQQKADKAQLKSLQNRLAELGQIISNLYEDKVLGKLSETVCNSMIAKYEQEQTEKTEALRILDGKLAEFEKDAQDVNSFLAAVKKYVAVEQLDREMLLELIDRIEIGKSTGTGKEKVRDIVIHYNFVGYIG